MNHVVVAAAVVVVVAAAASVVVAVVAAVIALFVGERKQLLPYLLSDKNTVIDLEFFGANTTKQSCHKIIFYETIKRRRPLLGHWNQFVCHSYRMLTVIIKAQLCSAMHSNSRQNSAYLGL